MTLENESHPVMDVIARLETLSRGHEAVTLGAVVEAFGRTAYVPMLIVPALIVFSPLSGIPILPSVLGFVIALIALQMSVGKRKLWLPVWLMRREVSSERLCKALKRLEPAGKWLDRTAKRRLSLLTAQPLILIPQIACIACGLAMPFLELVPFSSSMLAAAVLCFAVSFLARDGVFVVLGGVFMAIAVAIILAIYGGAILALMA